MLTGLMVMNTMSRGRAPRAQTPTRSLICEYGTRVNSFLDMPYCVLTNKPAYGSYNLEGVLEAVDAKLPFAGELLNRCGAMQRISESQSK